MEFSRIDTYWQRITCPDCNKQEEYETQVRPNTYSYKTLTCGTSVGFTPTKVYVYKTAGLQPTETTGQILEMQPVYLKSCQGINYFNHLDSVPNLTVDYVYSR